MTVLWKLPALQWVGGRDTSDGRSEDEATVRDLGPWTATVSGWSFSHDGWGPRSILSLLFCIQLRSSGCEFWRVVLLTLRSPVGHLYAMKVIHA